MIEKQLDIINKLGLHARAAAKVVSVASRYDSRIHVLNNGKPVDAKSIMGLLMASNAVGRIVAPPLFGLLYGQVAFDAPWYAGAAMIALVAIIGVQTVRLLDARRAAATM